MKKLALVLISSSLLLAGCVYYPYQDSLYDYPDNYYYPYRGNYYLNFSYSYPYGYYYPSYGYYYPWGGVRHHHGPYRRR